MDHLRSSLADLRQLFERGITVLSIAEPLRSFDAERPAAEVRAFMESNDYDVLGVRVNGRVAGYARRVDLDRAALGAHRRDFTAAETLAETAPLSSAFRGLRLLERVFVSIHDDVWGIVTRGDLQKAAVRMWLFGLVSLIEMQLLRLVRAFHPHDRWKSLLKPARIVEAERILEERGRRNEAIDLADCLQLCDKRDILLATDAFMREAGFASLTKARDVMGDLEKLRNDLAHAQDIIAGRWPGLVDLASDSERLLETCERLHAE